MKSVVARVVQILETLVVASVTSLAGFTESKVESVDGTYCFDFNRAFAEANALVVVLHTLTS